MDLAALEHTAVLLGAFMTIAAALGSVDCVARAD